MSTPPPGWSDALPEKPAPPQDSPDAAPPAAAPAGLELAGVWRRGGAHAADYALLMLVILPFGLFTDVFADDVSLGTLLITMVCVLGAAFLALCVPMALMGGRTLGKRLAGVRVVREDGTEVDLRRSVLREIVGRCLLGIIPLYALFDYARVTRPDRCTWHDRVARTRVVRDPAYPRRTAVTCLGAAGGLAVTVAVAIAMAAAMSGFSERDRDEFLAGCTGAGADPAICSCVYEELRVSVDYEDYIANTAPARHAGQAAVMECGRRLLGPAIPN